MSRRLLIACSIAAIAAGLALTTIALTALAAVTPDGPGLAAMTLPGLGLLWAACTLAGPYPRR